MRTTQPIGLCQGAGCVTIYFAYEFSSIHIYRWKNSPPKVNPIRRNWVCSRRWKLSYKKNVAEGIFFMRVFLARHRIASPEWMKANRNGVQQGTCPKSQSDETAGICIHIILSYIICMRVCGARGWLCVWPAHAMPCHAIGRCAIGCERE